jgi:hypothetical protein
MNKKIFLLHPFVFAVLPIISLLSFNIDSVPVREAFRPMLISLSVTTLLLFLVNLVVKDWRRTGLVVSLFLILFFSYGHVYGGYIGPTTGGIFKYVNLIGRHHYLLVVWLLILVLGIWIVFRLNQLLPGLANFFNLLAIVTLMTPLYRIGIYEWRLSQPWPNSFETKLPGSAPVLSGAPDIYYIILDGYGGEEILKEFYQLDNNDFLSFLKSKGFYIASQSHSNYIQTMLSLSSSMNMTYLDFLQTDASNSSDRAPLARLIRWSQLRTFLESRGYQTIAFASGLRGTELENADVYISPHLSGVTSFERLVIDTSALVLLQDILRGMDVPYYPGYKIHRERIEFTLDELGQVAKRPGPKFVFAHLIIPHPPFVFESNGQPLEPKYPFYILDGSAYLGTKEEYLQGYRGQLLYLNTRVEALLDQILSESERPPVIIIQADHGPGSGFDWDNPDATGLRERVTILNAYYLPGLEEQVLYPTISPVNSFRVVLNQYFGADFSILPDVSYYSNWTNPYTFTDVTQYEPGP